MISMVKINLYQPSGWVDVASIMGAALTFNLIVGGRGTGKTFGFLEEFRYLHPAKFFFMRRQKNQADLISNPEFSPFVPVDKKHGANTVLQKIPHCQGISGIYEGELQSDGRILPGGPALGYVGALASIHNVRGFSLDVNELVLDEFNPELGERPIKNEFDVFRNAYETINRNRELEGRPPLRCWLLSNSNQLGNPYFVGLRIVEIVDKMISRGQDVYRDESRGLMIINLKDSPISEAKARTALYRLSGNDSFTAMALGNQFAHESRSKTGSYPLQELIPIVRIGELQIYRHKGSRNLYGSTHLSGNPDSYQTDDGSIARFRARYGWLWIDYMDDRILWQNYVSELLFRRFFGESY